jgi:NTE family protein
MTHTIALVLGAGGSAGQAWQIGVIAGLADAGLDLTEAADLVIGTSSGSTTAAWVRSGIPPAELLASALAPPARPPSAQPAPPAQPSGPSQPVSAAEPSQPVSAAEPSQPASVAQPSPAVEAERPGGGQREQPPSMPMATVFERMRAIGAAATSAADLQRAMGAFGLASDAALGPAVAQQRRAMVAARLPRHDWPERPMIIVALNAHTGELATFDRESGVDLVDALTAAIALPGGSPTHDINGTRYINGGVRSADNADLASGYDTVVVVSPFSGRTGPLPEGQFEGLRRFPGADLASQVQVLREQGSHVEVITPDAGSRAAMGVNQMDPATRAPAARAGFAQGRQAAASLTLR